MTRQMLVVVAAVSAAAWSAASAAEAAPSAPRVELVAAPTVLKVGEACTVTVTYRWPAGPAMQPVREPDPGLEFSGEYVVAMPAPERVATGEEERRVFTISVLARRSGVWALPQPVLRLRSSTGAALSATAPAVLIQVGSATTAVHLPAARPAWQRPPAPPQPAWWLYVIGLGVLLGAAAIAALWLLRRPPQAVRTPEEDFAAELDAAAAASDGKDAGALLSLALRRYAGVLYCFDGPGSTTRETAAHVRVLGAAVPAEETHELVRLLSTLDDLRWSPGELAITALAPCLREARTWQAAAAQRRARELQAQQREAAAAVSASDDAVGTSMERRP